MFNYSFLKSLLRRVMKASPRVLPQSPSTESFPRGFTLLELLIVVGIVVALSVTTILVINPAEISKNSRDSVRLDELKTINAALNLYVVSGYSAFGDPNRVYVSLPSSETNCSDLDLPALPVGWEYICKPTSTFRNINGDGWIPVNFSLLSGGSPLSALPVDPINTSSSGNYYTYITGGSWELGAVLESEKYQIGGDSDMVSGDGGDSLATYETGSIGGLTLSPFKDVAPSSLSYTSPNVYTNGTAITALSPAITGLVASYSVSPSLPTGLSLHTTTGVISGTPTAITSIEEYTVTATNTGGSTTSGVVITVNAVAPSSLSYTSPNVYTNGTAITSLSPSVTGTVVSYSVSPSLPTGLSFNTSTGVISGTPTVNTGIATYTVTATNTGGSTTFGVVITVNAVAPTSLSYTSPNVYINGTAITSLSPSVTGTVVSYSVSPSLPTGLSFNTSTGVISGTPTVNTGIATYTVTATNTGGSTTFGVVITVNANPFDPFVFNGITYAAVTGADGRLWLDRNLGATRIATAFNDQAAYGWLYQWGRASDGHQYTAWGAQPSPALSGSTATLSTTDTPGHANFIKNGTSPYAWRNPQNTNLWQGVSGVNNPCPTDFRLPTKPEWQTLVTAAGITNYNNAFSSTLKFTAGGVRDNFNAALGNQGGSGWYWSSGVTGTNSFYLYFDSAEVSLAGSLYHSYGFSARCLKN